MFLGFCPRAVTFGADAALWSADWIVACLRACSSVFKTRVALSNRNSLVCFDRDEYPMHAEWNEALGLPRSSIWLRIDVELVSSPLYYYNFSWIVRVLSEASTHKGLQYIRVQYLRMEVLSYFRTSGSTTYSTLYCTRVLVYNRPYWFIVPVRVQCGRIDKL